jgi:hypothetical protein
MDVNMVFTIPAEFRALSKDITELALGANVPCSISQKTQVCT